MDSLIANTLQPEGWIAYLQMVELIKCVYKTKYSKYKSIKKYDKRTKNLRIYIIDAGSNNNGWRHFGSSEQRKSSVLFPIQSEKSPDSGFCTWSGFKSENSQL